MAKKSYFIAGTDTDIGKTYVATALLRAANNKGLKTIALKPVAAGCEDTAEGLRNDDAVMLQQEASVKLSYEQVNPVALPDALSPHIAAQRAGRTIGIDRLAGFCRGSLMTPVDLVLIEGAGGWRVPVNAREYLSSLPKRLNTPVILVVGMRLGCLNHAMLTAETIHRDGCEIAGWVANCIDSDMVELDANIDTLKQLLPFPHIGTVPFTKDLMTAASALDIEKII